MWHAGDDIKAGDVIADKYRVERVLGRGGMGMVVAVWHQDLHERRAIKFMLPKAAQHAEAVERFLREARAAARLKSSHTVKIHDVARTPTGVPYIVMEYLEGMDLEKLLETRGSLGMDEACRYILQACEAIGEAHALGIVHRDLKPANLFVTTGVRGDPFVKVLDFGIAKVTRGMDSMDAESPSLTVAHKTMGTPAYMSPEHVSNSKTVDGRSDIWSLGVMLYKLTTGSLPFAANHHPLLYAKILDNREMAPPPSRSHSAITPDFDAVVLRCLEKNIYTRFQTIAELVEAITPFATGARTHLPSLAGNLVTVPMGTMPLDQLEQNEQPLSRDRAIIPSVAAGTPLAAVGPTSQGGVVRAAHQTTSMRNAIVASAIAGSLITGIAVWIMVAVGRNDGASETVARPAIRDESIIPFQNKPTSEPTASILSPIPETSLAASNSSAPKLSVPLAQSAPKPTGQKKQPTTKKNPANNEFSTRK